MQRSSKVKLIWLAAGAAVIAGLMYVPVRDARRAARESGQRALLVEIERQLAAHHDVHGQYPESLDGMQFTYSDGADAETLKRIRYFTDGTYYRLVTRGDSTGKEISVCK